jgi:hypothetical protein
MPARAQASYFRLAINRRRNDGFQAAQTPCLIREIHAPHPDGHVFRVGSEIRHN